MTLRDAVQEALAAWMMFEDDGGRADYDRLVPKMTALRAALAQEEAGPSRAALKELFEAAHDWAGEVGYDYDMSRDPDCPDKTRRFTQALARCEREAREMEHGKRGEPKGSDQPLSDDARGAASVHAFIPPPALVHCPRCEGKRTQACPACSGGTKPCPGIERGCEREARGQTDEG